MPPLERRKMDGSHPLDGLIAQSILLTHRDFAE